MDTYEAIEEALLLRLSGHEVRKLHPESESVMVEVPVILEEPDTSVVDTLQRPSLVIVWSEDEPDMPRMHSGEPYIAGVASSDDEGPRQFFTEDEPQPYVFRYMIHAFADDAMMSRDLAMLVERELPFRGTLDVGGRAINCFRVSRANLSGGDAYPRYHLMWQYEIHAWTYYPNTRSTVNVRRETVVELGTRRFRSSSRGLVPVDSAGNPVDGASALDTLDVIRIGHDLPPE